MSKKDSYKKEAAPEAALDKVTGDQDPKGSVPGDAIPTAGKTVNAVEASSVKEEQIPKTVVNTKKVAELVSGGAAPRTGVATPVLRAAGRINYSGSADFIGGDKSATAEGRAIVKSGDRPGRQQDTALQHIDDVPAETYVVPIKTIPNLGDNGATVAYNGKYRNAHKVSQKGSGGSPADADFFRTIDECQYDILYYGMGQVNSVSADERDVTYSKWDNSNPQNEHWVNNNTATFGGYLARRMRVIFDANGVFESINFDVDDLSTPTLDEMAMRASGDALLRENNLYELDRLNMIDKAGDETKPNWSFMGKVTPNARGVATVVSEVEKTIGDLMYLSGTKLSHALAYQNNKAAKDGLRRVATMFEMMESNVEGTSHRFYDAGFDDNSNYTADKLFRSGSRYNDCMAHGSAAMYIAMMDSVTKYNTKGKALSLPLSFKTAISTFRQNCGELRAHTNFINEFQRQETFGKIDADPTGLNPYFISDGAGLIMPLNILNGDLAKANIDDPILRYHYEDLRNKYDVPLWNYFIEGLTNFIKKYQNKITREIKPYNDGDKTQKAAYGNRYNSSYNDKFIWEVPITSTVTGLSMWDILLCAASKDIAIARRYAYDAVIQYEEMNGYPFHGATKLSDVRIGGTANIGFTDITEPLKTQPVPLNVGVRLLMPEVFWVKGYAADDSIDGAGGVSNAHGTLGSVVLPWYFNQNSFSITQALSGKNHIWVNNPESMDCMTFFDFRGGASLENADRVFSMDPEQLKLCMDRMTVAPGLDKQIKNLNDDFYPTVLKYSAHEDGIPVLLAYIASEQPLETQYRITIKDILTAPRELGLSFIAPSGIVTPNYEESKNANYRSVDSSYFVVSGPSFRVRCWSSTPLADVGHELFDEHRSGDYAVNLKAHYYEIHAQPALVGTDIGLVLTANTGAGLTILTERHNAEVQVRANTEYVYENGVYTGNEVPTARAADSTFHTDADLALASSKTISIGKYFYTRLNYLPFVINPFDVNTKKFTGTEDTANNKIIGCNNFDIYDFLHLFNMCGFRCGEYSAAAVDRDRARVELGIGYVEDPYIQRRA